MSKRTVFVNRTTELKELNKLLRFDDRRPAGVFLLYGRRRVGKTVLLRHWAAQSGLVTTYWAAEKESAALQRKSLMAQILNTSPDDTLTSDNWTSLWRSMVGIFQQSDRPRILILDELPYAAEADGAMLSTLQHAWDQHFKEMNIALVLCGSHVRSMETLMARGSPLFGRMSQQLHLQPLSFAALKAFFPKWSAEERVAAYAIVGGVPAYMEWLDPQRSLTDNIRDIILSSSSMFVAEPTFLLYDEVREPGQYLSVLKAIGAGNHSFDEISNACLIGKDHLSFYLTRLQELRMVERRLPATVEPRARGKSRLGRYHLTDAYFRFFFRFIAPYQTTLAFDREPVLEAIKAGLRSFVGGTVFEELAREWVRQAARRGEIGFVPDVIGSTWKRGVQVDVVAVNWREKRVLIGECKWGTTDIPDHKVSRGLVEDKTPHVLAALPDGGEGWQVTHALFGREAPTPAARRALGSSGFAVDLARLDRELEEG